LDRCVDSFCYAEEFGAMGGKDTLGEFEHFVLLAILRLGERAYGVPIRRDIAERTRRAVTIGQLYSALNRLEMKGYVSTTVADPTPVRGGRAKKYYAVSPSGLRALRRSREAFTVMWKGITLPAR
jgi:DNA-binding PadR family transcriptional regulator